MHEPTSLDTLLEQAWQHSAAGDAASAVQLAQQAHSQDPEHAPAATALGYFLLQAGQYEAAHAVLWPAIEQWPQSATLQWYAGLAERQLGRTESAIDLLRCLQQCGELAIAQVWQHALEEFFFCAPDAVVAQRHRHRAARIQRILDAF